MIEKGLASFSVLKKTKKTESKNSWTLFFFLTISPPCLGLSFFQTTKKYKFSIPLPDIFQHQGSGNSLRGAKGSLYWSCPIRIPSKCWGWSNLRTLNSQPLLLLWEAIGGEISQNIYCLSRVNTNKIDCYLIMLY